MGVGEESVADISRIFKGFVHATKLNLFCSPAAKDKKYGKAKIVAIN